MIKFNLKKKWKEFKIEFTKTDLERYLEKSSDYADLEERMKRWNNKQHHCNKVF